MKVGEVTIQDTFAEAWDLEVVRLVLTALSADLAMGGAQQFVGAAGSSELGSRINAGIERTARPQETPDGRPGVLVACTMPPNRRADLIDELAQRVVLATLIPTLAVFDAMLPGDNPKPCLHHALHGPAVRFAYPRSYFFDICQIHGVVHVPQRIDFAPPHGHPNREHIRWGRG